MAAKLKWPGLRTYEGEHLQRIALPLGGIGTGTVSLGGRGNLCDWEVMNRPAKGYVPGPRFSGAPFLCLRAQAAGKPPVTRLLEGPVPAHEIQGSMGSVAANHGWPRFREAHFDTAYPLGQVHLRDPEVPLQARIEAFNPFVPADTEASSLPLAVLRCVLRNPGKKTVKASVCLSVPNFVGHDGAEGECVCNRNRRRKMQGLQGILLDSTVSSQPRRSGAVWHWRRRQPECRHALHGSRPAGGLRSSTSGMISKGMIGSMTVLPMGKPCPSRPSPPRRVYLQGPSGP